MRVEFVEVAMQLALIAGYMLGMAFFGAVGAYLEYQAWLSYTAGEYSLAAWAAALGLVVLFLGFLIGRDKLWNVARTLS